MQRRFNVRNERNLYHRECDLCKKKIISMYSLGKPFPVYCSTCWWGDKWDSTKYRVNYDFSKPFFLQFELLLNKVPRPSLIIPNSKNCDYCNYIADGKNSYLCFGSIAIENCLYGSPYESKYCVDNYLARECEYCYECIDCEKLSQSSFARSVLILLILSTVLIVKIVKIALDALDFVVKNIIFLIKLTQKKNFWKEKRTTFRYKKRVR